MPKYKYEYDWQLKRRDYMGDTSHYQANRGQITSLYLPLRPPSKLTAKDNFFRKPQPASEALSARQRKGADLTSHILGERAIRLETQGLDEAMLRTSFKWTDARSETRKEAVGRSQTPQERRLQESESHLFPTDKPSPQVPRLPQCKENVQLRATDHNYSDLFGREFSHVKQSTKPRFTPVLQSRAPIHLPSAKAVKQYTLSTGTTRAVPAPQEAGVDTYQVKGLKPGAEERSSKRLCAGLHVVAVDTSMDDITGECKGKATVTLRHFPRSDSEARLNVSLASAGLEVSPYRPKLARQNHYNALAGRDFLDCHSQREEKRLADRALTPVLSKMRQLESSDDLYGSSPGTGRWSKQWEAKPVLDLSLDKSLEQLHQPGRPRLPPRH